MSNGKRGLFFVIISKTKSNIFALFILCALIVLFFPESPAMRNDKLRKINIEKSGRLTIADFAIEVSNIPQPVEIRAVVSQETKFRVSYSIAKRFPNIDLKQLTLGSVHWIKEVEPAGKKHLPDSWAGVFLAYDADFGYVQSLLRTHRVYRKYAEKFEIDYVFSSEIIPRADLSLYLHEIDKKVFESLKQNGVLPK